MLPLFLFILAILASIIHLSVTKKWKNTSAEVLLSYIILFNIGLMGLLAFYSHLFMADETARMIGWAPGSPFQSEIGMANLSYGVLGILAFWYRGLFWFATVLGQAIFFLGAFIVHMIQISQGDFAPFNAGPLVWIGDLVLPLFSLFLLYHYLKGHRKLEIK